VRQVGRVHNVCGIGGWLGFLPNGNHYAERLVKALHHRGPDAQGIKSWREATLVHTRLSIIDLSEAGRQPLANEDARIWTVFNGEIYNHREIRRKLETRGHIFKGHSDTEILPHLYEEEDWEFVKSLQGMFAIAMYDARTRTLVLARDRFGIKPLFFALGGNRIAFASEIRALLEMPGINSQPNRQAIYDFAALSYIPAPETFYSGIRALQPGEVLVAQLNGEGVTYNLRSYNQWAITPDPSLTLSEATKQADALITNGVRQQMESDVPLGTLLSGGIDSSLVSCAAQEALEGRLQTFNVRFQDGAFDETWAALAVAKHINSHHQTLDMIDGQGSWDYVSSLLVHSGQPFADTSLFAVNAVCRLLRQYVTVALSGDGGDEGFGGYQVFWKLARIARLQTLPPLIWRGASNVLKPLALFGGISEKWARPLKDLVGADDTSILQLLFSWIREKEHRALCRDTHLLPVRRLFEPHWEHVFSSGASRIERLSAHATEINLRMALPNDYLFKVDTASMRESLEVRVPLLNEDLFAFGLSLPHRLKVKGRTCKRVLREAAKWHLPSAVANKPKRGFGIPVDSWVDSDFKVRLRETLLGPSSKLPEFFRPNVYGPVIKAFSEGHSLPNISRQGLYQRAIMFLAVQLSLESGPSRL